MTTPTIVTCGDLAALAGPWTHLWQHDPRAMVPDRDALCHCWDGSSLGSGRPPEDASPVECEAPLLVPLAEGLVIRVCCLCMRAFADALRDGGDGAHLHYWLLGQAGDALRWRDQRRLDSSPVACDMDVEAAAVMDAMEGDER